MASFETCTYHTVTLQPGEQFNLPPGAVIVSVTDPGAITSVSDCANLDNIETPQCYIVAVGKPDCPSNMCRANVFGYILNGVEYPFSSPIYVNTDQDAIADSITASAIGGAAIIQLCSGNKYLHQADAGNPGDTWWYTISTIPSIGNNLALYGDIQYSNDNGSGWTNFPNIWPFEPIDVARAGTDHPEIFDCFGCSLT